MVPNKSIPVHAMNNAASRYAIALLAFAVALMCGRALGPPLGDYVAYAVGFLALAF